MEPLILIIGQNIFELHGPFVSHHFSKHFFFDSLCTFLFLDKHITFIIPPLLLSTPSISQGKLSQIEILAVGCIVCYCSLISIAVVYSTLKIKLSGK